MADFDKLSISLPEELAAEVDDIASAEGLTRSAVIREATADYVAARKSADYQEKRRERIDRAIEGFGELLKRWGPDEKAGLTYLSDVRGESGDDSSDWGAADDLP